MGILDEFNPTRDGWSFVNWGEANDFTWDLYRRTHLAINPTNDPIESPLDVAFFQIFKGCAANGNCGGSRSASDRYTWKARRSWTGEEIHSTSTPLLRARRPVITGTGGGVFSRSRAQRYSSGRAGQPLLPG